MTDRPPATGFPIEFRECRTRFRSVAATAGAEVESHVIAARDPDDGELSIDAVQLGADRPERALVVMAGVHGVEGIATSPIAAAAVGRWAERELPGGVGITVVHGVNPWGMAWWRRQNESNVDLNRNWGADEPAGDDANPGYSVMHPILCPDAPTPPTAESMLEQSRELVAEHGDDWVRAAVADGQSTHPDGLYFAGHRVEESTAIVADIARRRLDDARLVVVVDLHTGFGAYGEMTLLARTPAGSGDDRWVRTSFPGFAVANTARSEGPPPRRGQIAAGLAELVPTAEFHAVTAEMGTRSDTTMILAERAEHWVHLHGDRTDPEHAAIVLHHLRCSAPDDRAWEARALELGARVLDDALTAVTAAG